MNKTELTTALAEQTELNFTEATLVINTFLEIIGKQLEKGEPVSIAGFGSFEAKKREERQGRNPNTGETITIPEKIVPNFKPASKLKEIVNQK